MLLVSALFQIPLALASVPLWTWQTEAFSFNFENPGALAIDPNDIWMIIGWASLFTALAGILGTFAGAAMVYIAGRGRDDGPPDLADVWRALGRLTPRLLGYLGVLVVGWIVVAAAVIAFILLVAALAAVLGPNSGVAVFWAIVAALVVFSVIFVAFIRLVLALPVLVLEGRGAVRSFVRSWELVRGSTWRTLGIFMVATLVLGLLGSVINPLYLPGMFEGFMSGSLAAYLVFALVSGAVNALIGPIMPILLTLLHRDYAAHSTAEP
jgi:hypothetical protein